MHRARRLTAMGLLALSATLTAACDRGPPPAPVASPAPAVPPVPKAPSPAKQTPTPAPGDVGQGELAPNVDPEALKWPAPDERYTLDLGFHVTDHDGNAMTLADLKGKPTAVSFIFTRCPNPQMCPLIVAMMSALQQKADDAGLADKIRLVLISYDPDYDTPARLKTFATERGLKLTNALMLRPKADEFRALMAEFQARFALTSAGQINHAMDLSILDHTGKLTRSYAGQWNNDMVLADLKRLVDEQHSAKGASASN